MFDGGALADQNGNLELPSISDAIWNLWYDTVMYFLILLVRLLMLIIIGLAMTGVVVICVTAKGIAILFRLLMEYNTDTTPELPQAKYSNRR